jgi:hypothetical protein
MIDEARASVVIRAEVNGEPGIVFALGSDLPEPVARQVTADALRIAAAELERGECADPGTVAWWQRGWPCAL